MRSIASAVSVLVVAGLMFPAVAIAGTKTFKATNYHHNVTFQGFEVGDVEGHMVGVYENKGVTVFEDGQEVELIIRGTLDQVKGLGPVDGYQVNTFDDGSVLTMAYQGEAKMTSEGRVVIGTYDSCRGTGQFEGAKCNGTWTSGPVGKTLQRFELEVTYTVPD